MPITDSTNTVNKKPALPQDLKLGWGTIGYRAELAQETIRKTPNHNVFMKDSMPGLFTGFAVGSIRTLRQVLQVGDNMDSTIDFEFCEAFYEATHTDLYEKIWSTRDSIGGNMVTLLSSTQEPQKSRGMDSHISRNYTFDTKEIWGGYDNKLRSIMKPPKLFTKERSWSAGTTTYTGIRSVGLEDWATEVVRISELFPRRPIWFFGDFADYVYTHKSVKAGDPRFVDIGCDRLHPCAIEDTTEQILRFPEELGVNPVFALQVPDLIDLFARRYSWTEGFTKTSQGTKLDASLAFTVEKNVVTSARNTQ